jgi:hypothetical protein
MSTLRTPWHFLTALDGDTPADRELLRLTRSYELDVVSNMILSSRVSLLYSMSGNGKTSLVNAGIVPEFQRRGYTVFRSRPRPPWCIEDPALAFRTCLLREAAPPLFTAAELRHLEELRDWTESAAGAPGTDVALARRLNMKLGRIVTDGADRDAFRSHMEGCLSLPIPEFIDQLKTFLDPDARMLFVCDQFEEVFVHFANTAKLRDFAAQLGDVWRDASFRAHILFSMREDWVGSMIEFRDEIPELFVNYFKLHPLRRSQGLTVLREPLQPFGLTFPQETAERILDDLATAYSANMRSQRGAMLGVPSPSEDPFLEAPALQIVAERLWETREEFAGDPFTLAHYGWLAGEASVAADGGDAAAKPAETPAQLVLDGYLDGLLARIEDAAGRPADVLRELRIDCLYLLTDTVRHRRALSAKRLLAELYAHRPQGLDLPEVDEELLHEALAPLMAKGLVRESAGVEGARQYELVHDFAVRAVVRRWRELDQSRTGALAVRRNEERQRQTVLAQLMEREVVGRYALVTLPALALALLLAASMANMVAFSRFGLPWTSGVGIVIGALGLLTAILALRDSRLFGFVLGTGLLATGVVLQWDPGIIWYVAHRIFLITLGLGVPLFLRALVEVAEDDAPPPRWLHRARITLANLLDGWLPERVAIIVLIVLTSIFPGWIVIGNVLVGGLSAVWALVCAAYLSKTGKTPGCRIAGVVVEADEGTPPRLPRAVLRQLLVIGAAAAWGWSWGTPSLQWLSTALLVIPLLEPFAAAALRRDSLYDAVTGTRVRQAVAGHPRRVRQMHWGLALVPAAIMLALFVHTEPRRRAEGDFASLDSRLQATSVESELVRNLLRNAGVSRSDSTSTYESTPLVDSLRTLASSEFLMSDTFASSVSMAVVARSWYPDRGTDCVRLVTPHSEIEYERTPYCRRIPSLAQATVTEDTTVVEPDTVPQPTVVPTTDTIIAYDSMTMAMDTIAADP